MQLCNKMVLVPTCCHRELIDICKTVDVVALLHILMSSLMIYIMQANKGFVHVFPDIATYLSNIPTVLTLCEIFSANSTITSYAVAKSAWAHRH